MERLADGFFDLYATLGAAAIVLIIWTMALIHRSAFINGNHEPWWVMQGRRAALALVAIAIMLEMQWHIAHGRSTWLPEHLLLLGIDLYLTTAIYSSYERLHRLGLTA
jgi:hypothetical protein